MKGLTAVGALLILLIAPARAATPEDVANDISANVMSPFCPGVTLHDCPTKNAIDLREQIEEMARDGFSRAQIVERLEADYGVSTIRAVPRGVEGIAAWLLPALAAVGGGGLAWFVLRKWVRVAPAPTGYDPAVHITPTDRERLERELRLFKEGA